jgi:Ca-activated chloride channel family protein
MPGINNITFAQPYFLLLWLLIPVMIGWYIWRQKDQVPYIQVSTLQGLEGKTRPWRQYLVHGLFVFRLVVIALLALILARPQSTNRWENVTTEGIDIILAQDISGSMLARDFVPDRLEAAKAVGVEFISGRQNDRVGLVVFSAESFTQCPLTTDRAVVINLLREVKSGMLQDGTAIGLGLANAVSRLKDSQAVSKVIILLTDGNNNTGEIDPVTAAEIAKSYGIRVYTIGVGSKGMAPYPVQTPFGIQYQNMEVQIDEDVLKKIAQTTGGEYFRATDNNKLKEIYGEIDQMEKSKIDVKEYSRKQEEYMSFALAAFVFLLAELFLRYTLLRHVP